MEIDTGRHWVGLSEVYIILGECWLLSVDSVHSVHCNYCIPDTIVRINCEHFRLTPFVCGYNRVGFYSPDEKWHLRNVTSDLFQWPLTGVAQVPLFDLVAFFGLYSGCCEGGWGGGEIGCDWLTKFTGTPGCLLGLLYPFPLFSQFWFESL